MAPIRQNKLPAANKIFVDRERPHRVFEDAAHAIPDDRSIVRVFYGVGGQGKTALCRELIRRSNPAAEPGYAFLRRSELDLHERPKNDPDRLLVWIRNGFANAGVVFPCFDLAFAITWEATRKEEPFPALTKAWLARTTSLGMTGIESAAKPLDAMLGDAARDFAGEVLGTLPGFGFMLKRIGHWAIEKGKRAYLEKTREPLKELYRDGELKKPYELSALLPWMLAQDFNAHIAESPGDRFLLFVDEYERVFDEGGAGTRWEDNPFDTHMRRLIQETNGLLAVFFSRERLPWGEHPDWRADLDDTQHLLGGLADKDADTFLAAIPIEDAAVRAAIIEGARETSDEGAPVYPLMLDLQMEHWRTLKAAGSAITAGLFEVEAASFESRRQEIVRRVLRDYGAPLQTTLERLAVARRFDRKAFAHVVQTFGTALPLDQFDRVANLSFVSAGADGFLTLHNAIGETVRETIDEDRRLSSVEALLGHFEARAELASPHPPTEENATAFAEAAFLRRSKSLDGYADWLVAAQERFLRASRHTLLIPLWREAAAEIEAAFGAGHADLATAIYNLAGLLNNRVAYDEVAALFERALAISETARGPEHAETVSILDALASAVHDDGDYDRSKLLYERALDIRERTLGPEHADTATTLNNLALLVKHRGDFAAAEPLYARSLAIREKVAGPDHEDTAMTLINIGYLKLDQGRYAEAQPAFGRALAIAEKVYGPDHPATATCVNALALNLRYQGDYAAAEPLFLRSLAIRRAALGADHIETTTAENNLAQLYQARGRYDEARPLFERALKAREENFGDDSHPTGISLHNLACLLQDQGDLDAALPLFQRAVTITESLFGTEHGSLASTLGRLGQVTQAKGDLAAARALFERAHRINHKALGDAHPATATAKANMARLLTETGEFEAAEKLFDEAIRVADAAHGERHPLSQRFRQGRAVLLLRTGRAEEALGLAETALGVHFVSSGDAHVWTRESRETVSAALKILGRDGASSFGTPSGDSSS